MGRHFGDLAVIRGIIYYKLSPHEQKPFAGAVSYGIPNMIPRVTSTITYWLPPVIAGLMLYKYVEDSYRDSKRKNPKDYENDVGLAPKPCEATKTTKESNKPEKKE